MQPADQISQALLAGPRYACICFQISARPHLFGQNECAEGTLDCGGLTPPWSSSALLQGGVEPPQSKALRALSF